MNIKKDLKITLIFSVIFYIVTLTAVNLKWENDWEKYREYDINSNGFMEDEEMTKEWEIARKKVSNGTAVGLARYTLIPISIFLGLMLFLILRIVSRIRRNRRIKE